MSLDDSRQAVTARAEIGAGIASLLNQFELGDDLPSEAAERILGFILSHERIHELIDQPVNIAHEVARVHGSQMQVGNLEKYRL